MNIINIIRYGFLILTTTHSLFSSYSHPYNTRSKKRKRSDHSLSTVKIRPKEIRSGGLQLSDFPNEIIYHIVLLNKHVDQLKILSALSLTSKQFEVVCKNLIIRNCKQLIETKQTRRYLSWAIIEGYSLIAKTLLANDKKFDVKTFYCGYLNGLSLAVYFGRKDVVFQLLSGGARYDKTNAHKWNLHPIKYAALKKHKEIIELLKKFLKDEGTENLLNTTYYLPGIKF